MPTTSSVSQWLKEARLSQAMPENGRPWTQDYFLARIKVETGWAPSYAPYLKAERGESTPRADTITRLRAFWANYEGVPPFPEGEPARALSLEERAVVAAERQADALELQAAIMARHVAAIETLIAERGETAPATAHPEAIEAMLGWGRSALERTRSQAPQPAPPPSTGR